MARASANTITLTSNDVTRIVVVLLGLTAIVTSFLTPWWTRGFTIDWNEDNNPRPAEAAGVEGLYWSYGPFQTPGAGNVSIDGYREFAAAALGIVLVLAALFMFVHLALRWAIQSGRVEANDDLPVRFAITAFWLGLAGVLIAALILPVAGPSPGWLFGSEADQPVPGFDGDGQFTEDVRFANVGFYVGLFAFLGYPAWLWADAARTRALAGTSTSKPRTAGSAY